MRTILFVCTGNTCRSPMAEGITRAWLARGGVGDPREVFVASAGVAAVEGALVTEEAIEALRRIGIEHDGSSKPLTSDMIRRADWVLCMTKAHVEAARRLVADDATQMRKVIQLDPAGDIDDPIGHGQRSYDDLAERLTELIPGRLKEILE